jgi:hypothetical protein
MVGTPAKGKNQALHIQRVQAMNHSLQIAVASFLLLLGALPSARAEQALLEPSLVASCLSLAKGSIDKPEYPQEMLDIRRG